jgi:nucleoside-diphosphate-sugar epimerase
MKILVTGANGFVGLHLTEKLLQEGHEVVALVRSPAKIRFSDKNLKIIKGDLSLSDSSWQNELPESLDVVIHTAGLVHSYNIQDFYDVNTTGTERLISLLKLKYTSLNFILISSLAAAGPTPKGIKKKTTDKDFPVSDYGKSKKEAEEILLKNRLPDWNVQIIRPPMVIGPRDNAVLDIFKMVRDGIVILPDLNSKKKEYSFVCVFDLVNTIVQSLELKEDNVFYSAHDSVITFEELIYTIQKQMDKKNILFLPLPSLITKSAALALSAAYRIYPHQLRLTPDKIKELLPFAWTCETNNTKEVLKQNFEYSLSDTIKITFEDYKNNSLL